MIITCQQCNYTDRREEETLKEKSTITFICPRCHNVENIYIKYTYSRMVNVDSISKE